MHSGGACGKLRIQGAVPLCAIVLSYHVFILGLVAVKRKSTFKISGVIKNT